VFKIVNMVYFYLQYNTEKGYIGLYYLIFK
jgi:hypothetical protein